MNIILRADPEPVQIDTARTALVVVDVQNAFCSKGGLFDMLGQLEEEKMNLLTDAGMVGIQMGVESGSSAIQSLFDRKTMNNERMMRAVIRHFYVFSKRMHGRFIAPRRNPSLEYL
jgi:hypothetical protein